MEALELIILFLLSGRGMVAEIQRIKTAVNRFRLHVQQQQKVRLSSWPAPCVSSAYAELSDAWVMWVVLQRSAAGGDIEASYVETLRALMDAVGLLVFPVDL